MAPALHASGAELQQLSSFYRLLNQAAASQSEHDVMRVFVEVLAVWQDVESWAYCADITGRFVLDAHLPGSDPERAPSTIDRSRLTADLSRPSKVPLDDIQAMGFRGTTDLLISSVRVPDSTEWLIISEHPGDPDAVARLGVYAQTVAQALTEVHTIQASRLTWAMLEHLLPSTGSVAHAAESAIAELASKVGAAAWLAVYSSDGDTILTAGDFIGGLSRPVPTRAPDTLVVPVDIGAAYQAVLGIRRAARGPLTGGDEELLRLAVAALGPWLTSAIDRHRTTHERRGSTRSFDDVLKRQLAVSLAEGEDVSVILVSLGREQAGPSLMQDCVARIRRELRPADMTGRLSSGAIGVLLPATPALDGQVVVQRLREALTTDPPGGLTGVSVALAAIPTARLRPSDMTTFTSGPSSSSRPGLAPPTDPAERTPHRSPASN